jgi:hypothetical protein
MKEPCLSSLSSLHEKRQSLLKSLTPDSLFNCSSLVPVGPNSSGEEFIPVGSKISLSSLARSLALSSKSISHHASWSMGSVDSCVLDNELRELISKPQVVVLSRWGGDYRAHPMSEGRWELVVGDGARVTVKRHDWPMAIRGIVVIEFQGVLDWTEEGNWPRHLPAINRDHQRRGIDNIKAPGLLHHLLLQQLRVICVWAPSSSTQPKNRYPLISTVTQRMQVVSDIWGLPFDCFLLHQPMGDDIKSWSVLPATHPVKFLLSDFIERQHPLDEEWHMICNPGGGW